MVYTGLGISILFIAIVARLLLKKYHPQAVLLIAGIFLLIIANLLNFSIPVLKKPTGFAGFDLFAFLKESFSSTNAGVGLMIMTIGGFVAYINKIGASDILVKMALKPLHLLKKHPHLSAIMVLPIGQLLFLCIPSAAGLGLLLMASVFPILIHLGVSKISAVSVISATTALCIGPASVITASAVQIGKLNTITYFLHDQVPLVIPLTLVLMVSYFFVNKYYDKKEEALKPAEPIKDEPTVKLPLIYAIIPVLPLLLLIVFSGLIPFLSPHIKLDTSTAMIISFFVAVLF